MTEDRNGGFGPKKPKATFGDVMLGIPAGRGGEREERGGKKPDRGGGRRGDRGPRGDRKERGPREERPAEAQQAAPAEGAVPSQPPEVRKQGSKDRGPKREPKERKEKGPLVVVRRATGAVETRSLEADAKPAATESNGAAAHAAEAPVEAKPSAPAHVPSTALYEDVPENQSFAEMFEQQSKQDGGPSKKHFRVGEKVTGKIFQLGADTAFVTIGGKSEAMIELNELKDAEGILRSGVGDMVEAFVIEAGAKGIYLSKQLSKGSASLAMLSEARASGMPVEGLVLSVNKGGLEVAVGDARAFCPASQVDVRFNGKLDQFVGEKLTFKVMEVRERNVVLSRRAILEEEQKALAAETRKSLAEGKVMKGKVTSVRDFGAFVDLGGVEGMIPVSELSHQRVHKASDVLNVGDEVEIEIIKIDPPNPNSPDKAKQKERITLSMRSRQPDPWKVAVEELKEGQQVTGKVVRLQPFGAFVELRPGVDGLIHVSALSNRRIAHPRDVVRVGDEVQVKIEKIDPEEKRVGLRLVREDGEVGASSEGASTPPAEQKPKQEGPRPRVGQVVTGQIDRIEQYGVFVAFPGGKGLVPASETGTERGTDMKRAFQMGQALTVQIIEIDGSGKIRLSLTAAKRAEERADLDAWKKSQGSGGGGKGFGTFADLLKGRKL